MSNQAFLFSWPGWETVRLIGRGSFGSVYEIRREVFGETEIAAMKVISIPQSESEIEQMYADGYGSETVASSIENRLKNIVAEYSLMRKMGGSGNIVNCDDVRYVQHADGIGWDIFIKMELLTPLTTGLPDFLSETTFIKIAKDLCSALELCKRHGILHRDIKPQNIFVSRNGDYKLGDFGIAKIVEDNRNGTRIGTVKYMAPEVFNNQPYGAAADIYSLGLVLYWILNERRMPFQPLPPTPLDMQSDEASMSRRLYGEQVPPPAHGSNALKQIVLKALAYDPAQRYGSPEEMLRDLEKAEAAMYASPFSDPLTDYNTDQNGATTGTGTRKPGNLLIPIVLGVVTLAAVVTLIVGISMLRSDNPSSVQNPQPQVQQTDPIVVQDPVYVPEQTVPAEPVQSGDKTVVIGQQPLDTNVKTGENAILYVEAYGTGLTYQWYSAPAGSGIFTPVSGGNTNVLSVEGTAEINGTQFYCVVTDVNGSTITTNIAVVRIRDDLRIVRQPANVTVAMGERARVVVEVTGQDLTFEWYYKNLGDKEFRKTDSSKDNDYTVEMSKQRHGRQLYCVITDGEGRSVTTNVVTIALRDAVLITAQPKDVTVKEGERAVVTVEASGKNLTYAWYYKNPGEREFTKTDSFTGNSYAVEMSESRSGRQLYCVITDSYGISVTTEVVTIKMR